MELKLRQNIAVKKGQDVRRLLVRIKFLAFNGSFQFVWGQEVINTTERVNRKVWSGTKICYYILHECLLLGNYQFLKTTIPAQTSSFSARGPNSAGSLTASYHFLPENGI